jgi:acyl-coenzyme A synthetase/AMP-(fatty) acid ligase
MLGKYADPSSLSAQETIAAMDELGRRIPCFNPKDAAKLASVEKALAKRNDILGVDALVARFEALSPEAQEQFLAKIQNVKLRKSVQSP